MNWTLDQLEAFVTSVKQGSFSAAARRLGKAQSRVSTAVANLEADLGFVLFDRSTKLPQLTAAGEEMFIEAQAVLEQCQRLQSRALTVSSGEEISFTIAMDEAVPIAAFEEFFQLAAIEFPLLKMTIINGSQEDIPLWVDKKKADLGILFHLKTLPDSLQFMPIGQFSHSLVVSPAHALAAVNEPTAVDLNRYRQLVICDRSGATQAKAISSNHWHIDSYYYITALVIRGLGWALIPEHIANEQWYSEQITKLSARNITDSLLVEMGVVKRLDQGVGPIMDWMLSEMQEILNKEK
ncbi:LysR family transcriptional regulator [Psychromonas ossibalaenae]|uniref:LysR family transcriptional regulator n=1 Tax=Psychromonas ossibalaenae TaxID=444922 RepID=UPI000379B9ED|nr:LysR family transcriptional regulator [Psychromonas ossibalaenae]